MNKAKIVLLLVAAALCLCVLQGYAHFTTSLVQNVQSDKNEDLTLSSQDEPLAIDEEFEAFLDNTYVEICGAEEGLDFDVFRKGLAGYYNLLGQNKIDRPNVLTIIDFQQPSVERRMFILDLEEKRIEFNTLVAHGRNTGVQIAKDFSNRVNSLQTSLGFYKTSNTYQGAHGYSLKLDGLERGINCKARERTIVLHGAKYVSPLFCAEYGYLGRSFGCPSVPMELHVPIINTIKEGSCMFLFASDQEYNSSTDVIDFACAAEVFANRHI